MKAYQRITVIIDANELHEALLGIPNMAGVTIKAGSVEVPLSECKLVQSFVAQRAVTLPPQLGLVYEHKDFPFVTEGQAMTEAALIIVEKTP